MSDTNYRAEAENVLLQAFDVSQDLTTEIQNALAAARAGEDFDATTIYEMCGKVRALAGHGKVLLK